MEKIEKVTINKNIHHIFCDDCGKHLQDSEEYDDGWYPNNYEYYRYFHFYNSHHELVNYEMKKTLCDNCANIIDNKISVALIEIGFVEENVDK